VSLCIPWSHVSWVAGKIKCVAVLGHVINRNLITLNLFESLLGTAVAELSETGSTKFIVLN